jgi:hypothetical protein
MCSWKMIASIPWPTTRKIPHQTCRSWSAGTAGTPPSRRRCGGNGIAPTLIGRRAVGSPMGQRRAGAEQGPRLIRASSRPTSYPASSWRRRLSQPTRSWAGGVFWCDLPIPRSPIVWRAGRPREFLPTPRPLQAANRGVCGGRCFGGAEDSERGRRAIIADATTSRTRSSQPRASARSRP